jgi:hypothetical protein
MQIITRNRYVQEEKFLILFLLKQKVETRKNYYDFITVML